MTPRTIIANVLCGAFMAGLLPAAHAHEPYSPDFQTSDRCVACHNGMTGAAGEDFSIGIDWSTSLMANSSRDPYWQASVRRETMDHAPAAAAIEDECSSCHMPIVRATAQSSGHPSQVFAHLPLKSKPDKAAADGVSCAVCHQITPQNLGTEASFNGNFVIAGTAADGSRAEYGPYDISAGRQRIMQSSTGGFKPQQGEHIRAAELCATCHTLTTVARDANGQAVGSLPEQRPYQEWLRSAFKNERTCQSCHMPAIDDTPITRILGETRPAAARHQFVGANFVMQRILARGHDELDVAADPQELYGAADRTTRYLQDSAARLELAAPALHAGRLEQDVAVVNLGGHKLPTAYPARRVWLHVAVRDRSGRTVFESGALHADGSIAGNPNDRDPLLYEPHHREIRSPDEVQIYEAILGDNHSRVTTGLVSAASYLKDNRLLPRGFAKDGAPDEIAVRGDAAADPGFTDQGHTIRYSIDVHGESGPFDISVELLYQPIGFRWAANLRGYDADEPRRFTGYFASLGSGTAVVLVKSASSTR